MLPPKYRRGKVHGRILRDIKGLIVTYKFLKAKRNGLDRIWIQIRQVKPKKWRVRASLSYAKAADIEFVEDLATTRPKKREAN